MRNRVVLLSLVSLWMLIYPTPVPAQFQEPTADELKMKADPKAPGAAAVYLYREETTDDTQHFHSYHDRIKVLTEKGKELATIRIPYEPGPFNVEGIQGRTIHSDGTVVPLTAKPNDLMELQAGSHQVNEMVFTLPSVEVGSVLEYRLDIHYNRNIVSPPHWQIQQPYFVHKAHYLFRPEQRMDQYVTDDSGQALDKLMFSARGFSYELVKRDKSGQYSLDLTDIRRPRMRTGCHRSIPSLGNWISITPTRYGRRNSGRMRESAGPGAWRG